MGTHLGLHVKCQLLLLQPTKSNVMNRLSSVIQFCYDYKQTDRAEELTQLALCKSEEEPRDDVAVEELENFCIVGHNVVFQLTLRTLFQR